MSKEGRKLDLAVAEYVEGARECWKCESRSFTHMHDYVVECDDCGDVVDVEAEYEDSKN